MNVEVRKIRTHPSEADLPFSPRIFYSSLAEALQKSTEILSKIPETEKYNCFITVGKANYNTPDSISRLWDSQECIMIDIDDIDTTKLHAYQKCILGFCPRLTPANITINFTGHGLHIFIYTNDTIKSPQFFKRNMAQYSALTSSLLAVLDEAKLPGSLDTGVWAPNRLTRLPGTLNKKEDKPQNMVELLWLGAERSPHSLATISGIAELNETLDTTHKAGSKTDTPTVLSECLFLNHCRDNAATLPEPLWHKMIGITAHLTEGDAITHELSKNHQMLNH
jgi:hypothetical protein